MSDTNPAPSNTPANADTAATSSPSPAGDAAGRGTADPAAQRNAGMVGGGMAGGSSAASESPQPDSGAATGAAGNSVTATGRQTGPDSRQGIGGAAVSTGHPPAGDATSPAAPVSPSNQDAGSLGVDAAGAGQHSAQDQAARAARTGLSPESAGSSHDAVDDGPSPMGGGIAKGTADAERRE